MARFLLVIVLWAPIALAWAQASELNIQGLMERLQETPEYRASFRETKHLSVLQQPQVLEGMLIYRPPDHLKKIVTSPHEKIYDIRGNTMIISSPGEATRRVSVDGHPLLRTLVDTLRGILAGNLEALQSTYDLHLEGTWQDWRLRLVPTRPEIGEAIQALTVAGQGAQIRTVKTLEANGDKSVINVKPNHGP